MVIHRWSYIDGHRSMVIHRWSYIASWLTLVFLSLSVDQISWRIGCVAVGEGPFGNLQLIIPCGIAAQNERKQNEKHSKYTSILRPYKETPQLHISRNQLILSLIAIDVFISRLSLDALLQGSSIYRWLFSVLRPNYGVHRRTRAVSTVSNRPWLDVSRGTEMKRMYIYFAKNQHDKRLLAVITIAPRLSTVLPHPSFDV